MSKGKGPRKGDFIYLRKNRVQILYWYHGNFYRSSPEGTSSGSLFLTPPPFPKRLRMFYQPFQFSLARGWAFAMNVNVGQKVQARKSATV